MKNLGEQTISLNEPIETNIMLGNGKPQKLTKLKATVYGEESKYIVTDFCSFMEFFAIIYSENYDEVFFFKKTRNNKYSKTNEIPLNILNTILKDVNKSKTKKNETVEQPTDGNEK